MANENPDKWVVVKLTKDSQVYYKVFGSWSGGYLDSDRWKLNSGISSVEDDEQHYIFNGVSGSRYICKKNAYGISNSYCESVLHTIIKKSDEADVVIEVLPETYDFLTLIEK